MHLPTLFSRSKSFLGLALSVAVALQASAQEDKLELLLERTPAPPNAMGYVNVESLNKLMSGSGMPQDVVKNVDEYWFIADLDIKSLRPKWEAGYAEMKSPVEAAPLAKAVGGYVDQVGTQDVIWSPGQTYLIPSPKKENRLGMLRPADRSLLTQWIEGYHGKSPSDFLQAQSKPPEQYLSLMLAIELRGALSPVPMAKKLEGLTSLKAQKPEGVAKILASMNGLNVLIGRGGLDECVVNISFSKSPASLKLIAADLLAEILERGGSAAPEVRTWAVTTSDTGMALKGPITEATLSGLIGIFSIQNQARGASAAGPDFSNRSEEEQVAYRSKAYFNDVNAVVERTRKHKSQTSGSLAKWNDSRARQIDEMGTLGVAPEMVQYGTNIAELLRGNSLTIRQGNIDAGKTKASQSLNKGYYSSDGYGYSYDFNSSSDYQHVTSAYARGNAYADWADSLNQIDKLTAEMRRAMTAKYKIQF